MAHLLQLVGNANSSTAAEVDPNTHALRGTVRPIDYGSLGVFSIGATSGTMAAGLAAASPIFHFRYPGSNLVLVRKVLFHAIGGSTAFTAGIGFFAMFPARSFTGASSAGTDITPAGSSNQGKLKTSMATSGVVGTHNITIASTATISTGIAANTDPNNPIAAITAQFLGTASQIIVPAGTVMYEARAGEYPLVLAINEGFQIQATVAATGTWAFSVNMVWEEVSSY